MDFANSTTTVVDDKEIDGVEDLGMPGLTKTVSIPEISAPSKSSRAFIGGMPRMIATHGDRSIPLPLLKLDKQFNEDEICCLTFTQKNIRYEDKSIPAGEAITKCAARVGDFGSGPAYSLFADTKCDDFKCDACYQQKDGDDELGKSSNKAEELDAESSECPAKKKRNTKLEFSQGVHRGSYKGKPIAVVVFAVGDPVGCLYEAVETFRYTLVAAKGEQELLQDFMEECLAMHKKMSVIRKRPETFCIYRWDSCQRRWSMDRVCKARSMDTVVLPTTKKSKITADLDTFLKTSTAEWYQKHGLPYKRSYLFYGLPGCGKTSMITALAGKHKRNVCFVCLSDQKMDDRQLTMAFEQLPREPFVVLEDVDSIFTKDRGSKVKNFLTFSGLLNALDGIGYKFGAVFFMTTNFVDRLDSALLRAGRCDVKMEFTKATDEQLKIYFEKFYAETVEKEPLEEASAEFVKCSKERFPEGVTLSTMQQHFIDHMTSDAMTCAKGIRDFEVDKNDQDGKEEKAEEKADEKKAEEKADEDQPSGEVKEFLESMRLEKHLPSLLLNGYNDMETLELGKVTDFSQMGVKLGKARLLHKKLADKVKARELQAKMTVAKPQSQNIGVAVPVGWGRPRSKSANSVLRDLAAPPNATLKEIMNAASAAKAQVLVSI